jgi:hypothetical protein
LLLLFIRALRVFKNSLGKILILSFLGFPFHGLYQDGISWSYTFQEVLIGIAF